MFKNLFSFNGRIRRTDFGITYLATYIAFVIIDNVVESSEGAILFLSLLVIPLLWISIAQGAKRAHDIGDSGWYQLIPFYILKLFFSDSDPGMNQYGPNPKEVGENEDQS